MTGLRENIPVYQYLQQSYSKGGVAENRLFQFVFRSFYRLDNAGLSDEQKTRYFMLMAAGQTDLQTILEELFDLKTKRGKKSVQFSFATKLLHTIDTGRPIYDKYVSSFTGIKLYFNSHEDDSKKISKAIIKYDELEQAYRELLLTNKDMLDLVKILRKEYRLAESDISNVKAIDFLIWAYGSKNIPKTGR